MVKLESKSHPEAELYGETSKPAMRPPAEKPNQPRTENHIPLSEKNQLIFDGITE